MNKVSIWDGEQQFCEEFWYLQFKRANISFNNKNSNIGIWMYNNGEFDIKKVKNV